jgi:hypothetical protein
MIENMCSCYDVAKVQMYATVMPIRLVVRISLRGADRVMILFRSMFLSVYSKVLGGYI